MNALALPQTGSVWRLEEDHHRSPVCVPAEDDQPLRDPLRKTIARKTFGERAPDQTPSRLSDDISLRDLVEAAFLEGEGSRLPNSWMVCSRPGSTVSAAGVVEIVRNTSFDAPGRIFSTCRVQTAIIPVAKASPMHELIVAARDRQFFGHCASPPTPTMARRFQAKAFSIGISERGREKEKPRQVGAFL